jgi:hypothetical protein
MMQFENFERTKQLEERRKNLFSRRFIQYHGLSKQEINFSDTIDFNGQKIRLMTSPKFPNQPSVIDDEDYEYIHQFDWDVRKDGNIILFTTEISNSVNNEKVDKYLLKHVLTGGNLGRKKWFVGFYNKRKEDNRLKNLILIERSVNYTKKFYQIITSKQVPFNGKLLDEYEEIKQRFMTNEETQIETAPVVATVRDTKVQVPATKEQVPRIHQRHRFTRRRCNHAESLEPMSKQSTSNVVFYSKFPITLKNRKYRVGIILKKDIDVKLLQKHREYTFPEIEKSCVAIFVIDEDDFFNIRKVNWTVNITKKSQDALIYIRSQSNTLKLTMQDFVTCRFLEKHKSEKSQWTIDHINRISTDNRLANLRLASLSTQQNNRGSSLLDEEQRALREEYTNIIRVAKNSETVYKTFPRSFIETTTSLEKDAETQREWEEDYAGFIPRKNTVSYTESDFDF